jgi:ABC-type branched-subunit amino acid transport system ATPase component
LATRTKKRTRAAASRPPRTRARSDAPVVLSASEVAVQFGGVSALDGVSMDVREGEIVGLIGPNGAGKTTFFECISGFQAYTQGRIEYMGDNLQQIPPERRAWIGIGRTLQNVRLFPYLSVIDNIRIALHRHMKRNALEHGFNLPAANVEEKSILARTEEIIEIFGMNAYADKYASELSYGTLRLLELACMIALDPKLLLLDEPSSGISQKETEALAPLLKRIQRDTGATILIIEHDMPLIMGLSDWIYVFDAGQVICEGPPAHVQRDPEVIDAYLGTPTERRAVQKAKTSHATKHKEQPLLETKGIDVFYDRVQVLYDTDFKVYPGERVALLGTNGAGKSTILKTVSGLVDPKKGGVFWKGDDITKMHAEERVKLGIGHVPGGRGLFPTLTVGENLRMGGYLYKSEDEVEREAERVMNYFPWIQERQTQLAGTLSGGEQQQLATGRALMLRPELVMIDELSLGLAPVIIERLMDSLMRMQEEEGLTIVIVEQQASFALGYTDRAYFLEKGEVRFEGPSGDLLGRSDLLRSVFLAGATASMDR